MSGAPFGQDGVTNLTPSQIVTPADVQTQTVTCPYCFIGYDKVVATRDGHGGLQADCKPKKCSQCFHYFRIGYQVQFVGVQMEG